MMVVMPLQHSYHHHHNSHPLHSTLRQSSSNLGPPLA